MRESINWKRAVAPSLADIEALAAQAWGRLPERFREKCGNLVIRVEDQALDEVLKTLGLASPRDLLGLYSGYSLKWRSVEASGQLPDLVLLYREAILYYWMHAEEPLGRIVTHVLFHEIGHHLGFSDEDIERIESEAEG